MTDTDDARRFPLIPEKGEPGPLSISWPLAEKAYSQYAARYGRNQSLQRLSERGGFYFGEMDEFYPGWRDEADEIALLTARAEKAEAALADAQEEIRRGNDHFIAAVKDRQRVEAEAAALREALKAWMLGVDLSETSSYCEYCETHAEASEDTGQPIAPVRHSVGCPVALSRAALDKEAADAE